MALKITSLTGNLVACLQSTRNKAVASFALTVLGIPWARFCTQLSCGKVKAPKENLNLIATLEEMGVDVSGIRRHRAFILKKNTTYSKSIKQFLTDKGADANMVASIVSRHPQLITRSYKVLDEMWNIWKGMLGDTDETILRIALRSPEAFFRTANTQKLLKNISYLQSLGLSPKVMRLLMVNSPRTFANSNELNKQNVKYLRELCSQLGGKNPQEFVRKLISTNIFILAKSRNLIQTNVELIKSLMKLDDRTLLRWLQGDGALILNLSYTYFEKNYNGVHAILQSLGCTESEICLFIFSTPRVLFLTPKLFEAKITALLELGIHVNEIFFNPRVLTVNINKLEYRLKEVAKCGYNFRTCGIANFLLSQPQFVAKLEYVRNSQLQKECVE